MVGTWYESTLLLRRKSLELTYNWKVSTPVLKRIPLIEINNQQTIPSDADGGSQLLTWERQTKDS